MRIRNSRTARTVGRWWCRHPHWLAKGSSEALQEPTGKQRHQRGLSGIGTVIRGLEWEVNWTPHRGLWSLERQVPTQRFLR